MISILPKDGIQKTASDYQSNVSDTVILENLRKDSIYKELNYNIIDITVNSHNNATYSLQIDRKFNEEVLEVCATKIRKNHPGHQLLMVHYLLPNMELEGGAWGLVSFEDTVIIDVKILDFMAL